MWSMPWLTILAIVIMTAIASLQRRAANPLARATSFEHLVRRYVEAL